MTNKTISNKMKSLAFWLFVIICFVGIPSLILLWAGNEYLTIQEKKAQTSFTMKLNKTSIRAKGYVETEAFWSTYFQNNIANKHKNLSIHELLKWFANDNNKAPKFYNYIAWDTKGKIASQSFKSRYSSNMWQEMLTVLLPYAKKQNKEKYYQSIKKRTLNLRILRDLLGPNLSIRSLYHDFHPNGKKLINVEFLGSKSKLWFSFTQNYVVAIFIDPRYFSDRPGIRVFLKKSSIQKNKTNFGMYLPHNTQPIQSSAKYNQYSDKLLKQLQTMDRNMISFTKNNEFYTGLVFFNPGIRIFAQMPNPYSFTTKLKFLAIEAFAIFILLSPILIYTFKTIVLGYPETLPIRWKMGFLFLFANGLPLLAMFALSQRYYNHKKLEVIKKMHRKSVSMLKNFDNKVLLIHAKYEKYLQDFCNIWAKSLGNKTITNEQYVQIAKRIDDLHTKSFFLVSSKYNCLATENGVDTNDYSNKLENLTGKSTLSIADKDKVLMTSLGKYLMNSLNGEDLPDSSMLKIGLFAESILQKSLTEITHTFVKAIDNISAWELQKSSNLSFLRFITTPNSSIIDYLLIIIWNASKLEDVAIKTSILSANRNSLHLKIIARKIKSKKIYPLNFQSSKELNRFLDLVSNRPNDEIETIIHNGEEYLCVGFRGIKLTSYQLAGLYPMKEVDRVISNQQKDMILLILFSTLLASGLAQLLSKSFNSPLQQIEDAALAIERREFKHKISATAKDEFGEIINIFNNAMVGLEELQVAKIVQESLFPSSDLVSGSFKTYGKVISKSELGGTHYDYFNIDDDYFGIFFAKVIDKGVSAALIMAMAKAGLIASSNSLLDPKNLTQRIYSLVHNTKHGKTSEIIQLQYICINKNNGEFSYANINMEPPIIVKNNDSWEFLKDDYSKQRLLSGDTIFFYTNCFKTGINDKENLQNLVISSDSSDIKVLCDMLVDRSQIANKDLASLEDVGIVASKRSKPSNDITDVKKDA